jgi:hypothetical protein
MVSFTPQPLYLRQDSPPVAAGYEAGHCREENSLLPLPVTNPDSSVVQPVAESLMEQVGLQAKLWAGIREVLGSNFGSDTGYPDRSSSFPHKQMSG